MLSDPLNTLPNLSPSRLDLLDRLGLRTVGDLLFHFPRTYEDLTDVRSIAALTEDNLQTVQGEVVEIEGRELVKGGCLVSVVVSDDGMNCLEGIWFNQPFAARRFRMGQRVAFSGKPRWYRDRFHNREHWQMNNPRVQILEGSAANEMGGVIPVYPLTEDLRAEHLRPLIRQVLDRHAAQLRDTLMDDLRIRHGFPGILRALEEIHFPSSLELAQQARRRFAYEELLHLQLALALRRREFRDREQAPTLPVSSAIDARIRRLFPFTLTVDQDRAITDICKDLASARPMQRLLQADVGAGKTAVAIYALLVTVANKHQCALMAPTEVLARQHYQTLDAYLHESRVRRLLLTGALSAGERQQALERIRSGDVDLVVGTQALVQSDVRFAKLGLVVIDEQHRFGVDQRSKMRKAGDADPHYLVMTATPIPRTVALTVFGDLDISVMRESPPGRQPVTTRWVPARQRDEVFARIRQGLREARQGFVVCPVIEETDRPGPRSAASVYQELQSGPLREFRLGLLHGRLNEADREQVLNAFRARTLDLLVTTTLVEVGIDIPNATMLLVEDADRFGLSQLHQLRGRVCRGATAGECWLFADPTTEEAQERLRIFTQTLDGFTLAEEDARLRGSGEMVGTRQHGGDALRFAAPLADHDLLHLARKDAFEIVASDAMLKRPEHALLRRAVLDRYRDTLALASIG